jgi:ceramide glucosyltransferase
MLAILFFVAAVLSLVYWTAVWLALRRFFRASRRPPSSLPPTASVLKPVKGADADAYVNFASFCRLDYPHYEVLFGVADPDDPAVKVVRRLQADFPERKVRLVEVPPGGANPKCASLHQLALEAEGEVLVMSDSDVFAAPDYLRCVVAPLQDPAVGAVTCPYVSRPADSLSSLLEAQYLDAEFVPSAIFAHESLGVLVGLGATIAVRRRDLIRAGGYAGVADYLTDDYQVVERISRLGLRVELCNYVVTHVLGDVGLREQWDREVRWALGVRTCSPCGYPGLLLTYTAPLALGLAAATGFSAGGTTMLAAALILRLLLAWQMQLLLRGRVDWRRLLWLPIRECLSLLVWTAGLTGRRVTWRGRVFDLSSDGRLEPS